MMELQINSNILGGIGFALFAVLVGTRVTVIGLRDYILILTIALLGTANVIEHWFMDSHLTTSCLVGFAIGFLADDVYLNIKATVPDFVKEIMTDFFQVIKTKLKKLLGIDT